MLNATQLFYRAQLGGCFHSELAIEDADRAALLLARRIIRGHLRTGIARLARERLGREIHPKFLTQGSFAYETVNDPATNPPQQVDLDDGIYLPLTLIQSAAPADASDTYFAIVDGLLDELAKTHRWTIDRSRPTCTRIHINKKCHVDVPMYAIPDHGYATLVEKSKARGHESLAAALREAASESWLTLSSDSVWLAVRGGKWIRSDPRKIEVWVAKQALLYGPIFKRVCKYLKAWRDHHWDKGGPSSILLMVCASIAIKANPSRDDRTLLSVAEQLATLLSGSVCNRDVDPTAELNDLSPTERVNAAQMARTLASNLHFAIEETSNRTLAVQKIVSVFGTRIPNQPSWVTDVAPADTVRATPAAVVGAPMVKRSHSA